MVKFSKKSFLIIIVAAILALSIVAGGIAYAQWDKTSKTLAEFDVSISDNTVLSVKTTPVKSQLNLLPTGAIIDKTKETDKLEIAAFEATITGDGKDGDYEIRWSFTECQMLKADGTPIESSKDYKKLFNILIYVKGDSTNAWASDTYRVTDKVVEYNVFITMNDPDTVDGFKEADGFDKATIMGQKFAYEITVDIKLKAKPQA